VYISVKTNLTLLVYLTVVLSVIAVLNFITVNIHNVFIGTCFHQAVMSFNDTHTHEGSQFISLDVYRIAGVY
jgi:hypothetical protein